MLQSTGPGVTDSTPHAPGRGRREQARVVAAVVLLALLIAFVIDNTGRVKVGFVFFDHGTRMIYVLIVTALVGVVIDRLWLRARNKH
jgi:uncharacterized integral membrane protein